MARHDGLKRSIGTASLAEELNHFLDEFEKDPDNVCLKSHEGLVGIQTGSSKIVHSGL